MDRSFICSCASICSVAKYDLESSRSSKSDFCASIDVEPCKKLRREQRKLESVFS